MKAYCEKCRSMLVNGACPRCSTQALPGKNINNKKFCLDCAVRGMGDFCAHCMQGSPVQSAAKNGVPKHA